MSSLSALHERYYNRRGIVINAGTDTPVGIRIRHTGSALVTSVVVTTATNIVLTDAAAVTTVAFATYTTMSSVVGAINASGTWEAKLLDALSTDASASCLVTGAITSSFDGNGNVVWDGLVDTDGADKQLAICLSPFRSFDSPKGHRVHLQEIIYNVTLGGAGANNFNVYERISPPAYPNGAGITEILQFTDTSVSATKTQYLFANGIGDMTAKDDREIIVVLKDAAMTDAAANYLRVTGVIE